MKKKWKPKNGKSCLYQINKIPKFVKKLFFNIDEKNDIFIYMKRYEIQRKRFGKHVS